MTISILTHVPFITTFNDSFFSTTNQFLCKGVPQVQCSIIHYLRPHMLIQMRVLLKVCFFKYSLYKIIRAINQ